MKHWQLLSTRTILQTPWMSILKKRYLMPGRAVEEDHYVIDRNDFVVAIATEGDTVRLVRHYRPAHDRFHWEAPGGGLEPGEPPETGAARELLEETGLTAASTRLLGVLYALPGYIRSTGSIVHCPLSDAPAAGFDRQEIDAVIQVSWDEVARMIVAGEIDEMQTVSALLLAREVLTRDARVPLPLLAAV